VVPILAAVLVAAAVVWGATRIATELKSKREDAARARLLAVFTELAPAAGAAAEDPRAVLVWEPLARTARTLFPDEFAQIDRAGGRPFPFGREQIEAAHAQWTADWLAWEGAHDVEFKLKAAALEEQLGGASASPSSRARFESIEREKLDRYQRRYQEYIRVAKALQNLAAGNPSR
jgi:hypothetical protein